jgi:hypothetical protein
MNSFDLQAVTFEPPCEWYSSNRPNPLLDHTGSTHVISCRITHRPSQSIVKRPEDHRRTESSDL